MFTCLVSNFVYFIKQDDGSFSEDLPLYGCPFVVLCSKESAYIVPVVFDGTGYYLLILGLAGLRQRPGKNIELLVVSILLYGSSSFKTINNQLYTCLNVFCWHAIVKSLKLCKLALSHLCSLWLEFLKWLFNLLVVEVKLFQVMGVKIPKLTLSVLLEGHKDCPMACYCKHYSKNERLFSFIILEIIYLFVKLFPAFDGKDQILVLKLPGKIHILKVLMVLFKNIKILKVLCTNFVVSSLKISMINVRISPWPLILLFTRMLNIKQKSLYFFFELPERGSTLHHILTF